jgi:hypothetical protein
MNHSSRGKFLDFSFPHGNILFTLFPEHCHFCFLTVRLSVERGSNGKKRYLV